MSTSPEELEFLELARGVRRVQTIEGSRYFGLPINAIITPDLIKAKRAEGAAKGLIEPKSALSRRLGATSPSLGKGVGTKAPVASPASSVGGSKQSSTKIVHKPSTIKGPKKFSVDTKRYSAPAGSTLIKPKGKSGLVYIRTPEGEIHAFNAADEVEIPAKLKPALTEKFGKNFKGDVTYEIKDFDTASEKSLPDLPTGSVLESDGTPQFKKLENGDWEHTELDVVVSEADIQSLYDSGELTLAETPEGQDAAGNTDYASMEPDEFLAALDAFPEGHTLYVAETEVVKQQGGKWQNSATGKSGTIPSSMRKFMSDKLPEKKLTKEEKVDAVSKTVDINPKKEKAESATPDATPTPKKESPSPTTDATPTPKKEKAASSTPTSKKESTSPTPDATPTPDVAPTPKSSEQPTPTKDSKESKPTQAPREEKTKLNTKDTIDPSEVAGKATGDRFLFDDGSGTKFVLLKNSEGMWEDPSGQGNADSSVEIEAARGYIYNYEFTKEKLRATSPGDTVVEVLPDGKRNSFTKQKNGSWELEGKNTEYPQTALYPSLEDGFLSEIFPSKSADNVPNTDETAKIKAEIKAEVAKPTPAPKGAYIVKNMAELPVNDVVKMNMPDGVVGRFKKYDEHYWDTVGGDPLDKTTYSQDSFADYIAKGEVYKDSKYTTGQDVGAHIAKLSAGTRVVRKYKTSPGSGTHIPDTTYQKNADGSWSRVGLPEGAKVVDQTNEGMKNLVHAKGFSLEFVSGDNEDFKDLQVGDKPDVLWFDQAKSGDTLIENPLFTSTPKPEVTWTKSIQGTWVSPDGTSLDEFEFSSKGKHFQVKIGRKAEPISDKSVIMTEDELKAMPIGAVISRTGESDLTKWPNGGWLDEEGTSYSSILHFAKINGQTVRVKSIPENAKPLEVPPAPISKPTSDLLPGDVIGGGTIVNKYKDSKTPKGKTTVTYVTPTGKVKVGVWWDSTKISTFKKKDENGGAADGPQNGPPVQGGPGVVPEGVDGQSGGTGDSSQGVAGQQNPSSNGSWFVLKGNRVDHKGVLPENARVKHLKDIGKNVPDVYELDSSKEAAVFTFHESMVDQKASSPYFASVYVYPEEE